MSSSAEKKRLRIFQLTTPEEPTPHSTREDQHAVDVSLLSFFSSSFHHRMENNVCTYVTYVCCPVLSRAVVWRSVRVRRRGGRRITLFFPADKTHKFRRGKLFLSPPLTLWEANSFSSPVVNSLVISRHI